MKLRFAIGEPIPWFTARNASNPEYHFGSVAGRHIVLLFLGSATRALPAEIYQTLMAQRALFDDITLSLFVVSMDPEDERQQHLQEMLPGVRIFWDSPATISLLFGVAQQAAEQGAVAFQPAAVVLDPTLRVMQYFLPTADAPNFSPALLRFLVALPVPLSGPAQQQAPVVIVPRIFEPELCQALIRYYEKTGGEDSGYMKKENGVIKGVIDYDMKRRHDCLIEDAALSKMVADRIRTRLLPEILRVFRFQATRMERYLIACYDGDSGGFFRPHRDNDGDGHRQFAVSLNLNTEEYTGGDLRFPEYGLQTYRPPSGGACVFSCSLMHEATPVTAGRRFVFLPFLYDEAAAAKREANNKKYIDPAHHYYQNGSAP